jgi:hypothetical protein
MADHRAGHCQRCGTYRWRLDRDHIVPKLLGGTDEPGNIQWLCQNCHCDKTYLEDKIHSTPEYSQKMSQAMKGRKITWVDKIRESQLRKEVVLKKRAAVIAGRAANPEGRRKSAEAASKAWAQPGEKERRGKLISESRKALFSKRKSNAQ